MHISALNNGAKWSNNRLRIACIAVHEGVKGMVRSFVDLGYNPNPIEIFGFYGEADSWLRDEIANSSV